MEKKYLVLLTVEHEKTNCLPVTDQFHYLQISDQPNPTETKESIFVFPGLRTQHP